MSLTVNIPDEIGVVVMKAAGKLAAAPNTKVPNLFYMFGHPLEITARLQELTNSPDKKGMKFPLVALFTDIIITRNSPLGFYGSARLNIVICNMTQQNYTAAERLENNFKPILQPIKDAFLEELYRHTQFSFFDQVKYSEIERYFWGKQGLYGNQANILNDYIDCIELQNLQINIDNIICSKTSNI